MSVQQFPISVIRYKAIFKIYIYIYINLGFIQRQILLNILTSRQILDTLLKAIVDVHTQNKIIIKFYNKNSKLVEINKGVRHRCPLSPVLFNT
jgi:adenylate kinase family enzyme